MYSQTDYIPHFRARPHFGDNNDRPGFPEHRRLVEFASADPSTALRDTERLIQWVLGAESAGIVILAAHGQITDANEIFLAMAGYSARDVMEERVWWPETFPGIREDGSARAQSVGSTGFQLFETTCVRKDGQRLSVLMVAGVLGIIRTDRLAFVVELREESRIRQNRTEQGAENSMLGYANGVNTLGELAASLVHEVKQPMGAVAINASVCLQALRCDTPDVAKACDAAARLMTAANSAVDIADSLHSLYMRAALWRERVDIHEIIRDSVILLQDEADRNSVRIRLDFGECLPMVLGDCVQIRQVVINLILNGIEAMENAPGLLVIKSRPAKNGEVLISVRDSGAGIPLEQADRIFDAFFSTKLNGTGMGLAISKTIIESHGGRLWAEPGPGYGALFCFTLPTNR